MAQDLNNLTIIGRLTKDPESVNNVVKFSIANNGFKDSTSFFNVVCFSKTGELVAKYLNKGSQVSIQGEIKQDTWEDKNSGQKRSAVSIIAQKVQFLGGKKDQGNQSNQSSQQNNPKSEFEHINFNSPNHTDIPF